VAANTTQLFCWSLEIISAARRGASGCVLTKHCAKVISSHWDEDAKFINVAKEKLSVSNQAYAQYRKAQGAAPLVRRSLTRQSCRQSKAQTWQVP
jgi:hypothetical protein